MAGTSALGSAAGPAWSSRTRDFAAYAQPFGMAAFRPASAANLYSTLMRALDHAGPTLVEIPIDYRENRRLTERLGALSHRG